MKAGDPIYLQYVTFNGDESVFVRASIYVDGVSTSERDLSHNGNGVYTYFSPSSLSFPINAFEVRAVYVVYSDSAFLELSEDHGRAEDIFRFSAGTDIAGISKLISDKLSSEITAVMGD
jgi:hypothetical protein